jgi:hypothetical protein
MVDHPILIQPPLIVQRTDANFVQGLFEDLKTTAGRRALRDAAERFRAKGLRLYQPIHRIQNILLIDVACDGYGYPRLDPDKIESCGLVVRRLASDERENPLQPERLEGWFEQSKRVRGWTNFAHASDLEQDPDGKRRQSLLRSGNVEINRRLISLAGNQSAFSEQVTPAFVAPPEVCEAAGRTLVFAVIPVASLETSETETAPQYSAQELANLLPTPLRQGQPRSLSPDALTTFLRILAFELGLFGESRTEKALFNALDAVILNDGTRAATKLYAIYRDTLEKSLPITTSLAWPAISQSMAAALFNAVAEVRQSRLSNVFPPAPRFEGLKAEYRARLFLRIKNHPECPPALYWSAYSDRFRIAPWYEPSGPPVKIQLPDINKDNIKDFKPNVAFQLPPALFDMLAKTTPKDFLDGKGKEGIGIGVAWICSFSLPIITLCAFIVLNIFLGLFQIIFSWLFYIKICIPVPIPTRKDA